MARKNTSEVELKITTTGADEAEEAAKTLDELDGESVEIDVDVDGAKEAAGDVEDLGDVFDTTEVKARQAERRAARAGDAMEGAGDQAAGNSRSRWAFRFAADGGAADRPRWPSGRITQSLGSSAPSRWCRRPVGSRRTLLPSDDGTASLRTTAQSCK